MFMTKRAGIATASQDKENIRAEINKFKKILDTKGRLSLFIGPLAVL